MKEERIGGGGLADAICILYYILFIMVYHRILNIDHCAIW